MTRSLPYLALAIAAALTAGCVRTTQQQRIAAAPQRDKVATAVELFNGARVEFAEPVAVEWDGSVEGYVVVQPPGGQGEPIRSARPVKVFGSDIAGYDLVEQVREPEWGKTAGIALGALLGLILIIG